VRKSNTGRFSENHQVHIFTEDKGDSDDLYSKLFANNITVNFDNPLGKGIFIRFGTQEITRRGMKETDMKQIVTYIDQSFKGIDIRDEVMAFNNRFRKIHYSFDE
jgi:glycine hydroxymethyltransferase